MNITVFTGNQPRHVALIERLASIAHTVFAVQECTTLFPGLIEDFYSKSDVMQEYFSLMTDAEKTVFGEPRFLPANVQSFSMKLGDLNKLPTDTVTQKLDASDYVVVFGASYIKEPLIDKLIARKAINIHMGVSPYYRGSTCNFWAGMDGHMELVGSTIHMLSKGLDSGDMLFHALPAPAAEDPFIIGMRAVEAAHKGLCAHLEAKDIFDMDAITQDKSKEIRYSKRAEFTDAAAEHFIKNRLSPVQTYDAMSKRDLSMLLHPFIPKNS